MTISRSRPGTCCCTKNNLTAAHGESQTEQRLSDIRVEQEEVGKKFYKQYKDARLALIGEIQQFNPGLKDDLDFVISKAQKIIDRVIFAAFAEDKGLLPDHTLRRLKQGVEDSRTGRRLWSALQDFFFAIDQGDPRLEIPEGYNGGLFAHDDELNRLMLGHDALAKVVNLSSYNFDEELSVTILGHIFEQSITDIEELKAIGDTEAAASGGSRSRRKKDGIFYTPDYIVRYIVENSLGVYLREHEERFLREAGLHEGIQDATYARREHQAYVAYFQFLRNIKVVDPACGSGAFLVYVFDYLLAEHQRVGTILGTDRAVGDYDQMYRSILRNNIYGVDLNEESVEIAKLSLWLKTAVKGKKLTALDQNIKVGNSLIDDPEVAGDKAFNWQEQFPEVFEQGGFDVVVGNPPYGATAGDADRTFLAEAYEAYEYQYNSYSLFYELALKKLKPKGILGFITPATFLYQRYFSNLRAVLQRHFPVAIAKHQYEVFADAEVGDTVSFHLRKTARSTGKTRLYLSTRPEDLQDQPLVIDGNQLVDVDGFYNLSTAPTRFKIGTERLGNIATITAGIKPYQVGKGIPKQTRETVNERPFSSSIKEDETYIECLIGRDFHRYRLINNQPAFLSYGDWLAEPRKSAPFFDERKIVLRQTSDKLIGYIDEKQRINLNNVYNVGCISDRYELDYILALLNSRLLDRIYQSISQEAGRTFAEVKKNYLSRLPIAAVELTLQKPLTNRATALLGLHQKSHDISQRFETILSTLMGSTNWPARLSRWWTLNFAEFVKALRVKLTLAQKDELLPVFEKYRDELAVLDAEIQRLDREIDQLVYQLYELTPEEIALVEASV